MAGLIQLNTPIKQPQLPYIYPMAFFSNFSASYLLTPGMKGFDFFELDLGYEYKIGKKIYGEIYGSKYFYSGGSNLINGNITSDIGSSFNYDFTYFQFNNQGIISCSNTNGSDPKNY